MKKNLSEGKNKNKNGNYKIKTVKLSGSKVRLATQRTAERQQVCKTQIFMCLKLFFQVCELPMGFIIMKAAL